MSKKKTKSKTVKKSRKTKKLSYALFLPRLLAALIDGVLLMVAGSALKRLIPFLDKSFFNTVLGALYYIVLWVNLKGQTVGKRVMELKIIREDGKPLTYQDALLRYLGYIVSVIPLFLGYFWIIWDDKKQGWHDKIAKTYVIKDEN
jgi:uncharacterized RDD family membrane protein YckC